MRPAPAAVRTSFDIREMGSKGRQDRLNVDIDQLVRDTVFQLSTGVP